MNAIYCPSCTKWKTCEHGRKAHPRDGITNVSYYIDKCDKYVPERHYYVYQGYKDWPIYHGYIIKCYTDEEYERYSRAFVLQRIESSYDNTDYIHDKFIHYNPRYIHRKPLSEGTFWGVPDDNENKGGRL